ncbi:SNF-domain-containing protein [Hortaea werneckii]|nr:SNF-domain-containing protein [Hortaea werneckii]KAI7720367.1 SNF-domain-containing protein [Hortaea werneckii]
MFNLKRVLNAIAPSPKQSADGRDQWPSRTSYVLASMGGAIGFGNLLRFPSQVFNNNGIQWFIPYVMAIFLLAIPILILEIATGQAYRAGSVAAYNSVDKRFKGIGLGCICVGYMVVVYYVPMLGYVMVYFRHSFTNNFAWTGRIEEFWTRDVTATVDPISGRFDGNGGVSRHVSYPGTGLDGELVGWNAFSWFIVWMCICKGVGVTGRVVYISIGLPIVIMIVLLGRGVSLPNAIDGIRLYWGEFNGSQLAGGALWQAATGQVFYSTGKNADAMQDSFIICLCNAAFEFVAAFAVFGVVGYLGLQPGEEELGTFSLGFLTFPVATEQMPGAPVWAVLFFLTLMLLGVSSSFAMLDALVTLLCDSSLGRKVSHFKIATSVVIFSFLLSLMYDTGFGYALLTAIDAQVNNVVLLFTVWSECVAMTSLYRTKDVIGQVGLPAFLTYNAGYAGGMILGPAVAHAVIPAAGAGVGFGIYILGVVLTLMLAKDPDSIPPKFWKNNKPLRTLWWVAIYQGEQLRRDLNVTVGTGRNWKIPFFWAPILRYVAAPILAIVYSFAYPSFYAVRDDPLQIMAFIVAHMVVLMILVTYVMPKSLDILIPVDRRGEGNRTYAPQVLLGKEDSRISEGLEYSAHSGSEEAGTPKEKALGDSVPHVQQL